MQPILYRRINRIETISSSNKYVDLSTGGPSRELLIDKCCVSRNVCLYPAGIIQTKATLWILAFPMSERDDLRRFKIFQRAQL